MIYLSCMRLNSLSLSKRSSVSEPFDMEIRSGIQPVKACRSMFYNVNEGSDLLTTRLLDHVKMFGCDKSKTHRNHPGLGAKLL